MTTCPTKPLDPVTSVTLGGAIMTVRLDHAARPQSGDGFRVMAEPGHDLVGVLAELRRRAVFGRLRRLGKIDRLPHHLDVAKLQ